MLTLNGELCFKNDIISADQVRGSHWCVFIADGNQTYFNNLGNASMLDTISPPSVFAGQIKFTPEQICYGNYI